jgi:hypothetical protein
MTSDQKVPMFSEAQLNDLSVILFDFFLESKISEDDIAKIVVELKYKLPQETSQLEQFDISEESRNFIPFSAVSLGDIFCAQGEGPGCGVGMHRVIP